MSSRPPRLIAFEGGEGAGKSTQIKLLAARLAASGVTVTMTREPGGTPAGAALRRLLLTPQEYGWTPAAETLLMVADRAQHLAQVIEPALARGETVLTDRYVFSTLAYQGTGRGGDQAVIGDLHARFCGDRWPDLTFVLDIDPVIGLARSHRRLAAEAGQETVFEDLDLAFHRRVRDAFLSFAATRLDVVVIDAAAAPETIAATIAAHV